MWRQTRWISTVLQTPQVVYNNNSGKNNQKQVSECAARRVEIVHILKGNIKMGYIILMGRTYKKNVRESNFYLQEQGKICSRGQQECAFNRYSRNTVIRKEIQFLQLNFLSASKEWLPLILWWGYTDLFFVILGMQRRRCKFHALLLDYPFFFFF